MSFNLKKGQRFELAKAAPGLSRVRIGLGWDPNEEPGGPDFDLDVSAFCLNSKFKIPSDSYFVFYGQVSMGNSIEDSVEKGLFRPKTEDGAILGAIDDPDGRRSDGNDDEDMVFDLNKISKEIEQVIICVTICKFPNDNNKDKRTLQQNFGMVNDCYVRILDDTNGTELCKYELKEKFSSEDAVEFGRLFRNGSSWEFEAMGRAHQGSMETLVGMYT